MVVVAVETDEVKEVRSFVYKAKKIIKSPKVHSGLHTGFPIEAFAKEGKLLVAYSYGVIGSQILNYIAFISATIILVFKGWSFWLLAPAFFILLPQILRFLGYWLVYRGLRKAGYKGKIKLLSNSEFITRAVL